MILRTLEDIAGTKGEAHGDKWHSMRLLHSEDDMGVTLTDSILEEGFEVTRWQKHHREACYCLEGTGTIEELNTGKVHRLKPGTLYAMNEHDCHRIRALTRMRVVCTSSPALTGLEQHGKDDSP